MRSVLLRIIFINTARALAGKFGAETGRRMVLLHGSKTSAGAFVNSPTKNGAKEFLAGVPRRTDAGSVAPPNWLFEALDATAVIPDGRGAAGTWFQDDGACTGMQASVAAIEAFIRDFGAVGIVGHEQGATAAAIVAARSALGEGVPLTFAVICGAKIPTAGPFAELFCRLRDSPESSVSTLHCIDTGPGSVSAEQLAACFAPSAEILRHDRGGAMPDREWWEQTRGYPERITGGRNWCTQHRGPFRYAAEDLVNAA